MHIRLIALRRVHFRPCGSCFRVYIRKKSSVPKAPVMAIRREDQSIWERRAPLAPQHVRQLVRKGVKVLVQPSNRRAYPMKDYTTAGATIQENISDASLIMGVKKPPWELVLPNKTYCFFSHTIKAQEANMGLLDAIIEKNIRLIDYEKMVNKNGQRVVAFGKWAGVAGMINILHGMGIRLLALGHHTPFMYIGPAHNYRNSSMAKQAFRDAGYDISIGLMPKSMGPLTFVFTGSGNVSQGAQEMFQELPHEYIDPTDLPKVSQQGDMKRVYGCVVRRDNHYVRKDGGPFDADEFGEHPERYSSTFAQNIAPYASCIVNGIYWAVNAPRLITIPDAKNLLRPTVQPWLPSSVGCPQLPHRLLAICDVSADPGGSIEFMTECTTIDKPFCLYDADQHTNTESFTGPGVLVCSIDNMPAQLPREATDFFGELLLPYVPDMLLSDARQAFEDYAAGPVVKDAVIASNGRLTPNYEYIEQLRLTKKRSNSKAMDLNTTSKKVLILGAGYVAPPVVDYLSRGGDIMITVASSVRDEADHLAEMYKNTDSIFLDVERDREKLVQLIPEYDVVVSLLPYSLHPKIAQLCIKNKVNMVTASYSHGLTKGPEGESLSKRAAAADITILNEMGLDPGIDHLLAMECFDEVKELGGKITSFRSFCGGLPAPEFSVNPLRYKFSWNPRSVFMAALSGAKYIENGQIKEIPEGGIALMESAKEFISIPGFNLEGYSNRDSLHYLKEYGIEGAHTCMRGTLRYKGYADCLIGLMKLGLLQPEAHPALHPDGPALTWRKFIATLTHQSSEGLLENLQRVIAERAGSQERLQAIIDLGLLADTELVKQNTPLDTVASYLKERLAYGKNERDMVILRHDVGIAWPNNTQENREITLVVYGDPNGYSAMAKTVGFPAAIGTKMLLDKEIQRKGMVVPLSKDIYRPVLQRLENEGIKAIQHSVRYEV